MSDEEGSPKEEKDDMQPPGTEDVGNIFISNETFELEEERSEERLALLAEFERRKRARQIQVSTDDTEVKKKLRENGQPICLFGEDAADRRNRLKDLMSTLGEDAVKKKKLSEPEPEVPIKRSDDTTWYHEGTNELKSARMWIAKYSLHRARSRLERARAEAELPEAAKNALRQEVQKAVNALAISGSQVGDARPVSYCRFSPDESMIATSSWSGLCKVWSLPDCEMIREYRGHTSNASAIVWHPQATMGLSKHAACLASCATDGSVKLWSLSREDPVMSIDDYMPHRVSRIQFHPSGKFLGACVWDNSWRLYDFEKKKEILHQEGHSKPPFDIVFQNDGSLVLTGGMDTYARVWDLRTGRCIMFMEGHLKPILSVSFHMNGYQAASGSEDNSCKIWDVRQRRCLYTIPAHNKLLSSVQFSPRSGLFLVTASYDGTAKVWAHPLWQPLKTLAGHDSRVMSFDISPKETQIVTASFDRTYKLWTPDL